MQKMDGSTNASEEDMSQNLGTYTNLTQPTYDNWFITFKTNSGWDESNSVSSVDHTLPIK